MRLSARILDLREQGYPITDEMMKDPNSGKRYKAYWLAEGL
ncbi:helix-turn-helix domain-containing protein [Avibacterium paragallinarum]